MTMLSGWAGLKESYPVSYLADSLRVGITELDQRGKRNIIQGEAGTLFGIAIAVKTDSISRTSPLNDRARRQLPEDLGGTIQIHTRRKAGNITWITAGGRLTKPEAVTEALDIIRLSTQSVLGCLGIITTRGTEIKRDQLDSSAPVSTLSSIVGGTVGLVSAMIRQEPRFGLTHNKRDGQQILNFTNSLMHHAGSDARTAAMTERIALKGVYANLMYSLHWIIIDPALEFVHALHSAEPGDDRRANPYLYIGKNEKNGTVAFSSLGHMMNPRFEIENPRSIPENEVVTLFTQIG